MRNLLAKIMKDPEFAVILFLAGITVVLGGLTILSGSDGLWPLSISAVGFGLIIWSAFEMAKVDKGVDKLIAELEKSLL